MSALINSEGYSDTSKMPTSFIPARSKSQTPTSFNKNIPNPKSPSPEPFDVLEIEKIPGLDEYLDPEEISLLFENHSNSTDFQPYHQAIDNLAQNCEVVINQIQDFSTIIQEGINYHLIPPTATKRFLAPCLKQCEIEANHRFCDKDTKEIIQSIPVFFPSKTE